MRKLVTLLTVITFISCKQDPIKSFYVIGLNNTASSIDFYSDSSYVQTSLNQDSEEGKWKGSFNTDSTIVTYIPWEGNQILSSSKYKVQKDTLKIISFSIR